jgi:ABC-2 type transport system ATP-binding protein
LNLTVENINKAFGEKQVLRDVSFNVRAGSAFGLIGRNGSGKTTTIRIIMGIFPADSGTVTVDGAPSGQAIGNLSRRFGYLPEERGLYPKRVIADQMAYICELRGMTAADARRRSLEMLERLEAGEYYKKKLDTLSKGNQQKIQLAIALLNDPELVILDEPFSGLDPVNARILKDIVIQLAREGRTVIFSSHQMSHVEEFCDDICMIDDGRIVMDGNLREIKHSYPRDRLLISPDDGDTNALRRALESEDAAALLASCEYTPRGALVTLRDELSRSRLLSLIVGGGAKLDSFTVVEPTLEEIFIERAGRADEAV